MTRRGCAWNGAPRRKDGRSCSTAGRSPALEQAGGRHAVVRLLVAHRDRDGHERLRSDLRLHVHAGQPFCKLVHRLLVVCADPGAAQYVAEATDERETLLAVRCCALQLPWTGARGVRFGGSRHPVEQGQPWLLRHEHDLAHRVGPAAAPHERSGRAPGHLVVQGDRGLLAVGVRNFWQTYPKGLRVGAAGVALELLPPRSGGDLPGDAEAWHRLYRWLDGDGYLLREGLALTTEVLIGFPADPAAAAPLFRWLEEPPLVRPLPAYTNSTGAVPRLAAKEGSPLPDYEALTAQGPAPAAGGSRGQPRLRPPQLRRLVRRRRLVLGQQRVRHPLWRLLGVPARR